MSDFFDDSYAPEPADYGHEGSPNEPSTVVSDAFFGVGARQDDFSFDEGDLEDQELLDYDAMAAQQAYDEERAELQAQRDQQIWQQYAHLPASAWQEAFQRSDAQAAEQQARFEAETTLGAQEANRVQFDAIGLADQFLGEATEAYGQCDPQQALELASAVLPELQAHFGPGIETSRLAIETAVQALQPQRLSPQAFARDNAAGAFGYIDKHTSIARNMTTPQAHAALQRLTAEAGPSTREIGQRALHEDLRSGRFEHYLDADGRARRPSTHERVYGAATSRVWRDES